MPLKIIYLPKKGYKNFSEVAVIPELKGSLDHEIALLFIEENQQVNHDYQTQIQTASSILRIILN